MPINANVSGGQQITASVGETKIDVAVSGGVGPSGAGGPAATITVGTVTTGAPGSSASVVNAGTTSAAVLNFTIPAGATGATGPQGATGPAGTTTWAGITDRPATFPPSTHTHVAANITDFAAAVVAAAPPTTNASLLTSGTLPDARLSANIARTSDVSSAVAAVVNAAPASLDTLKELADALGNDASFASTVTNSLASKAPLANPTFTGTVSGITKAMVGLGNVPNTDATARANHTGTQAISTVSGLQTALDAKAPLADPEFIGTVSAGDVSVIGPVQCRSLTVATASGTFTVSGTGTVTAGTWQGNAIAVANGGTGATTASAARTNLGLAIGTDVAAASHTQAWSTITSTPTTLAGYGITDAVSSSDSRLTDARTPLFHTHSAAQISDFSSAVAAAAPVTSVNGQTGAVTVSASAAVRSDTVGSTSYIGRAVSGSATSASVWTIRRSIFTSAGAVSSTATATNVAWDNRLTASYS